MLLFSPILDGCSPVLSRNLVGGRELSLILLKLLRVPRVVSLNDTHYALTLLSIFRCVGFCCIACISREVNLAASDFDFLYNCLFISVVCVVFLLLLLFDSNIDRGHLVLRVRHTVDL